MKKLLAIIMCLVMLLSFAACGNADVTSSNVDADATKKETIVVGYTIYEPMNFKDESGKLVGFDTELAEKVFGNLGYDVNFKEIVWDNKYTDLNSNVIDCVWNGFTCNTSDDDGVARADKVDFSYNYMENLQVVVAKKDAGFKAAEDLKGKIASAEGGSAGETYAKDTFKDIVFKSASVQTDALMAVNAGTADFAVLDNQLAKSYCGKGDYENLQIVDGLSSQVEYYAIGFKKGSELTAKVNAELEKLAADGTITAIAKKYGVENTAIIDFADQKK